VSLFFMASVRVRGQSSRVANRPAGSCSRTVTKWENFPPPTGFYPRMV
jgi:hypothetical protein